MKSIKNFLETSSLAVAVQHFQGKDYVLVVSDEGSMRLQHTMTVAQALEMANAILDAAIAIERKQK